MRGDGTEYLFLELDPVWPKVMVVFDLAQASAWALSFVSSFALSELWHVTALTSCVLSAY
jgi:hypothetical protein